MLEKLWQKKDRRKQWRRKKQKNRRRLATHKRRKREPRASEDNECVCVCVFGANVTFSSISRVPSQVQVIDVMVTVCKVKVMYVGVRITATH